MVVTRKTVDVQNLIMVSWAKERPMKFCQRAMIRDARRMRSSLTSRISRMMRSVRRIDRSSIVSSSERRVKMSNGIVEMRSMKNQLRM